MPPTLRKSSKTTDKGKGVRKGKWTGSETSKLIANIKQQLKVRDPLSWSKRIKALNWDEIAIPPRSINDCKSHFDDGIKKIHRTRTLGEILTDVEVDVEPATDTENGILPVNFTMWDEKKRSHLASEPVELTNNNLQSMDSVSVDGVLITRWSVDYTIN